MDSSTSAALPSHGRITCRRCFGGNDHVLEIGKWRVVNDPGAWGSATPRTLVLGFSKGFTQATAYRFGRFDDIPFKDMRPRLTETLRLLGILRPNEDVSSRMVEGERDLAFGSLVRCSLSRENPKTGSHECTGQVMPKAFSEEISTVVSRCMETFLGQLPSSVSLVLMLGTTDAYIKGCRAAMKRLGGSAFSEINDVAYRRGNTTFVHVSHPSGLNGHHSMWMTGDGNTTAGRKRLLACDAIAKAGPPT